jgi:Methylase involved in ubiquinone/menaquinone biosynthesis
MKSFEYALENNRLRSIVREAMEVRRLRSVADIGEIGRALHIACGGGDPTRLILKHFDVRSLSGLDRDPAVVEFARRTYPDFDFSVGDVRDLSFGDCSFDAAFDLADLHNYADWQRGLAELFRVLRPGGLLILEEISRETFSRGAGRLFKALTDHPYDSMLTIPDFRSRVEQLGFRVVRFEEKNPLGLLRYFIMAARKPE